MSSLLLGRHEASDEVISPRLRYSDEVDIVVSSDVPDSGIVARRLLELLEFPIRDTMGVQQLRPFIGQHPDDGIQVG